MISETVFLKSQKTGAVVGLLEEGSEPIFSGNEKMEKAPALPGKDIINVEKRGMEVKVMVTVPVSWVYLRTNRGGQRKSLAECESVCFHLTEERPVEVFAYTDDKKLYKVEI